MKIVLALFSLFAAQYSDQVRWFLNALVIMECHKSNKKWAEMIILGEISSNCGKNNMNIFWLNKTEGFRTSVSVIYFSIQLLDL